MNRVRVRRNRWALNPRAYWAVRRWSPALMLFGEAVGGYFLLRAILVWGVGGVDYPFAWDVPLAGLTLAAWAAIVKVALAPPVAVAASSSQAVGSAPALVASLDVRSSVQFIVAAPLIGVLAATLPFTFVTAFGGTPGIPANLLVGLPLAVVVTAFGLAMTWVVTGSLRHGVVLTSAVLVDYGYIRRRRFARHAIVTVRVVRIGWWTTLVRLMLRNDAEDCIRLTLADGSEHRLSASLTPVGSTRRGAEIIQAWIDRRGSETHVERAR